MFRFGTGFATLNCKLSEFNHEQNPQSREPVKRKFYTDFCDYEVTQYKKKSKKKRTLEEELELER